MFYFLWLIGTILIYGVYSFLKRYFEDKAPLFRFRQTVLIAYEVSSIFLVVVVFIIHQYTRIESDARLASPMEDRPISISVGKRKTFDSSYLKQTDTVFALMLGECNGDTLPVYLKHRVDTITPKLTWHTKSVYIDTQLIIVDTVYLKDTMDVGSENRSFVKIHRNYLAHMDKQLHVRCDLICQSNDSFLQQKSSRFSDLTELEDSACWVWILKPLKKGCVPVSIALTPMYMGPTALFPKEPRELEFKTVLIKPNIFNTVKEFIEQHIDEAVIGVIVALFGAVCTWIAGFIKTINKSKQVQAGFNAGQNNKPGQPKRHRKLIIIFLTIGIVLLALITWSRL